MAWNYIITITPFHLELIWKATCLLKEVVEYFLCILAAILKRRGSRSLFIHADAHSHWLKLKTHLIKWGRARWILCSMYAKLIDFFFYVCVRKHFNFCFTYLKKYLNFCQIHHLSKPVAGLYLWWSMSYDGYNMEIRDYNMEIREQLYLLVGNIYIYIYTVGQKSI